MAASNACPMAVAFWLASSISPKIPDMVLCMVSIIVRMLCIIAIIGGNCGDQLRHEHVHLIEVFDEIMHLVGKLINTVECIEYGSQREADRNIVAMLFPVEVAADRPPEILEIRSLISQFIDDTASSFVTINV